MRTEPVVLVHGWGGSFRATWQAPGWEALLEDAGRTVIGVDLLGHGAAPKPHDAAAYDDLTTRIVDALPPDGSPVDAVGFSLGAATLLEVACRQPERFGKLVVGGVGANLFRDDEEGRAKIIAAVRGGGDSGDIRSQLFAQYSRQPGNDAEALALVLERSAPRPDPQRFAAVTCPVLVCIGDNDFAGPGDPLVDALPDATLVVLKNTDHFATPESFAFIDAALEFLEAAPG